MTKRPLLEGYAIARLLKRVFVALVPPSPFGHFPPMEVRNLGEGTLRQT